MIYFHYYVGFSGWRKHSDNSMATRGEGKAATSSAVWHRACNEFPLQVELSPSLSKMVTGWNLTTSYWLRCYVYNRVWRWGGTKKATTFHILVTQLVSAVWHGMKWGNIAFFFMSVFQIKVARVIFKRVTLVATKAAPNLLPLIDFLQWIWSFFSLGFFSFPFIVMEVAYFVPIWFDVSSLPFWSVIALVLLFDALMPSGGKRKGS